MPVVMPDQVLKDLDRLWAGLAEQTHDEPGGTAVRACAMTLIVLADASDETTAIGATLAEVMREHPHRAVILQVRPGAELDYRVTAQCWSPVGARQQICCERIEITAAPEALAEITPVLAAIAAPDLPVLLWCRSTELAYSPAVAPLRAAAEKTLLRSRTAEDLARPEIPRVADLAWTKITRWREIVAEVFADPARRAGLPGVTAVRVLHREGAAPAEAYYVAGWVLSVLGRKDLRVEFEAVPGAAGAIQGVEFTGGGHSISIRRATDTAVLIVADGLKGCAGCGRYREAEVLSAELRITSRDAVYERARPVAARLAAGR